MKKDEKRYGGESGEKVSNTALKCNMWWSCCCHQVGLQVWLQTVVRHIVVYIIEFLFQWVLRCSN